MKFSVSLLVLLLGAPVLAVPVSVSVLDSKGAPIVGAAVELQAAGKTPGGTETAVSDAKGVATFEVEPNATEPTYAGRVLAWKPGFALGGGTLWVKGLQLTLAAPTSVAGTLADENGKPVVGATVRAGYFRAPNANFGISVFEGPNIKTPIETVSDKDGKWQLDNVPPDVMVSVSIRAAGRVNADVQIASGASSQTVLGPGAQIGGRLLGLDGKPLAKVRVYASEQTRDFGSRSFGEAETKTDGTFSISGLKKGVYKVAFTPSEDASFVVAPVPDVAATPEKAVQLLDSRAVAGTLIGGTIRAGDDAKTPVAGVNVMLQSDEDSNHYESATTDDKGKWQIRTLEKAAHLYIGGARREFNFGADRQRRAVAVGEGNTHLDFSLPRNVQINGRLVDETGRGVQTSAFVLRQGKRDDEFTLESDATGNFSAFVPAWGEVEIGVSRWNDAPDGDTWDVVGSPKLVVEGKPLVIKIRRAQLASLEVGVFDQDDAAVEGVKVVVNLKTPQGENESWQPRELVSDKTGRVHLDGIRANQKVDFGSATKEGFDTGDLPKLALQNGVYRADISLKRRSGKAEGRVLDAAGAPVEGAQVYSSGLQTKSDAAGHFLIAPLPGGKVEVLAWKNEGFALGQSDGTRLDLKPQILGATDVARAKEVLAALQLETKGTGYWRRESLDSVLAGGDFNASAASARGAGFGGITGVIMRFKNDESIPLERWIPLLQSAPNPTERLYNAAMWSSQMAFLPDNEATRAYLAALQSDVKGIENVKDDSQKWQNATGIFGAAALSERIGDQNAADTFFERGNAFIIDNFPETGANRQTQTQDKMFASLAEIVAVSPRLLSKLTALVEPDSSSYSTLLRNGAPVVARLRGLDAAKPFLDLLKTAPTPKAAEDSHPTNIEWLYSQAVLDCVVAGAKSNPKLALELAQSLPKTSNMGNDDSRAQAFCEAAGFQAPDIAAGLWREYLPKLEGSLAMKYVARVALSNEPLAREFYEAVRDALDAQPAADPNAPIYGREPQVAAFSFYEARFAPARARYRLERGFQNAQKSLNARYELADYARAMAAFDPDRALLWADTIGNTDNNFAGFEAKRHIARFLSLDAATRRKMSFGDRFGRDNEDWD